MLLRAALLNKNNTEDDVNGLTLTSRTEDRPTPDRLSINLFWTHEAGGAAYSAVLYNLHIALWNCFRSCNYCICTMYSFHNICIAAVRHLGSSLWSLCLCLHPLLWSMCGVVWQFHCSCLTRAMDINSLATLYCGQHIAAPFSRKKTVATTPLCGHMPFDFKNQLAVAKYMQATWQNDHRAGLWSKHGCCRHLQLPNSVYQWLWAWLSRHHHTHTTQPLVHPKDRDSEVKQVAQVRPRSKHFKFLTFLRT